MEDRKAKVTLLYWYLITGPVYGVEKTGQRKPSEGHQEYSLGVRKSVRDWSLITKRGGGYKTGGGGHVMFYPCKKGGGRKKFQPC